MSSDSQLMTSQLTAFTNMCQHRAVSHREAYREGLTNSTAALTNVRGTTLRQVHAAASASQLPVALTPSIQRT
jgi:hypothetical protein